MTTVTIYSFDDGEGEGDVSVTLDYGKARRKAGKEKLRCFIDTYEFRARKVLWDFSGKNCGHVIYAACEQGYKIQVWQKQGKSETPEVVREYNGGNHRRDSTLYVPLDSLDCVPSEELLEMATNTARDLAGEFGIHPSKVQYDHDLESLLKEELG